jgi:hypothetical protein
MIDHESKVAGRVHVELDTIGSQLPRQSEGGRRVLVGVAGCAAVGDDERGQGSGFRFEVSGIRGKVPEGEAAQPLTPDP